MPCTVVVGAAWGDEGKGKIVSYLAIKDDLDVCIRTGSINAGHTVVFRGKEYRLRMVPSAFVHKRCKLYVGPGANVHPKTFLAEVELTNTHGRAWVDKRCSVIETRHILADKRSSHLAKTIQTTGSGVGPAVEARVRRIARLAQDVDELKPYLADVAIEANRAINEGLSVLLEGTQGLMLSLYHGTYPYVTSRDTSTAGVCSEAGIPPTKVDQVIMTVKSYMTRVGAGPLPGELPLEEAKRRRWLEIATVTGRFRRVAPLNYELTRRAAMINGATQIALTKLDVLFPECKGAKSLDELTAEALQFVEKLEREVGIPVTLVGTGPGVHDIIDVREEKLLTYPIRA